MTFKFFTIPTADPERAEADINRFLASHRVSQIERHFVPDGTASFWALCITWVEGVEGGGAAAGSDGARRGRIDYREILPADEFALYDRLRTLRKQSAEAEGLPPFAVFTNEQLADMVRRRVTTAAELGAIDGLGEARLTRYGPAFLEVLRDGVPRLGPASATTTSASGCPERLPSVAGKPSGGTRPRPVRPGGANRQGPGALVGRDANARRWPVLTSFTRIHSFPSPAKASTSWAITPRLEVEASAGRWRRRRTGQFLRGLGAWEPARPPGKHERPQPPTAG